VGCLSKTSSLTYAPPTRFPVKLKLAGEQITIQSRANITLKENAREILEARGIEWVCLDISRWSDRFSGTVGIIFKKNNAGKLSHLAEGRYLRFGGSGVDPTSFLEDFPGNRITVNGFAMTLKKVGKILGRGKNRIALVLDIEIRGDEQVEYDISRDRIVGAHAVFIRSGLDEAICKGLVDTSVMERLAPETRKVVDPSLRTAELGLEEFEDQGQREILEYMSKYLSKDRRPTKPLSRIASELGITREQASRALHIVAKTRARRRLDGTSEVTPPQSPEHVQPPREAAGSNPET